MVLAVFSHQISLSLYVIRMSCSDRVYIAAVVMAYPLENVTRISCSVGA